MLFKSKFSGLTVVKACTLDNTAGDTCLKMYRRTKCISIHDKVNTVLLELFFLSYLWQEWSEETGGSPLQIFFRWIRMTNK